MRSRSVILFAVLLTFCGYSAYADDVSSQEIYRSYLRINSPTELAKVWNKKLGSVAIGNFGYVPWGRTLVGNLRYANPGDGCSYDASAEDSGAYDEDDDSPILVADRGNCTFTTKALQAQIQGAKMLIVLDDRIEITEEIIPIGDGHEKGVHIPTVVINKAAGDMLRKELQKKEIDGQTRRSIITVVMFFNFPRRTKIEYEVWLSSTDMKSINFVRELETYIPRLGTNTSFTPYYTSWESNNKGSEYAQQHCISGGKYCAPDPDNEGPLKGTDTIEENLRQLCIWQKGQKYWWEYYKLLNKDDVLTTEIHKSSKKTIRSIGLDYDEIVDCVNNSFEVKGDREKDTKLLIRNQARLDERNIQFWPSVVINNFTYRGNMEGREVFEALCEGFSDIPASCIEDPAGPKGKKSGGVAGPLFLLILVIGIFGLIFLVYKRWLKKNLIREMNTQMNVKISQYFSMADLQTR